MGNPAVSGWQASPAGDGVTDLHYVPQASANLLNWTVVPSTVLVPDNGSGMQTMQATNTVARSAGARRFLRLLATSL